MVQYVKRMRTYKSFEKLSRDMISDARRASDAERDWVKTQRVMRVLENVALAANLSKVADGSTQQRYKRLLDAESQTIIP